MILPSKGIVPERALLSVGAQISIILSEPMTISQIWTGLKVWRKTHANNTALPFAWFVLALDMLYALEAVHFDGQLIHKIAKR